MPRSIEALVVGRVIGDVIDTFDPILDMSVVYPTRHVSNGCEMKLSALADRPQVRIGTHADANALFTLMMIDPDAPSPSESSLREWVHWIVSDIPAGTDASHGREIMAYDAPRPVIGIHRYVFVLFKQSGPMPSPGPSPPSSRANFRTRDFACDHCLGLPVAAVYFNSQKQSVARRRSK